jgi:hypothetical protein
MIQNSLVYYGVPLLIFVTSQKSTPRSYSRTGLGLCFFPGWFTGVCSWNVDISEHPVCFIFIPTRLWRWNTQRVPKRWNLNYRRQGITQKKANICAVTVYLRIPRQNILETSCFELSGIQRHSSATPACFPSFLPLSPTIPQTPYVVCLVFILLGVSDLYVCTNKLCLGLGVKIGFRQCEAIQGNPGYRKGRYVLQCEYVVKVQNQLDETKYAVLLPQHVSGTNMPIIRSTISK